MKLHALTNSTTNIPKNPLAAWSFDEDDPDIELLRCMAKKRRDDRDALAARYGEHAGDVIQANVCAEFERITGTHCRYQGIAYTMRLIDRAEPGLSADIIDRALTGRPCRQKDPAFIEQKSCETSAQAFKRWWQQLFSTAPTHTTTSHRAAGQEAHDGQNA